MAGLMGNPYGYRGSITGNRDFNTIIDNGVYKLVGATGANNADIGYGTLVVEINDNYGYQMITNVGTTKTTVKMRNYSDSGWAPWTVIDNFGYNTLVDLATALKPLLGLS